jgi:septal ring-binding cell division protein DamX
MAVCRRTPDLKPALRIILLLFLLITLQPANAATVSLPIELDYPLLRQLLINQLFDTPEQNAEILKDPTGCSRILLANPQLAMAEQIQPGLRFIAEVKARLGIGMLGACTDLLQWQGSAAFILRPVIQPGGKSLQIEPVDSWLIGADGRKITSGKIWDLASDHFNHLFDRFTLDLSPSIDALGSMFPDVLPRRSLQQLQTIVASLKLKQIHTSTGSLVATLTFEVDELMQRHRPEPVLSPAEQQRWDTRWQAMDALFTFAIKYYASITDLPELRSTLLEILLDSRYQLVEALTMPASRSDDPVRHWFLDSWQRLSPVIRRIGLQQPGQEPLLWTSLLTATDALYALDRLGPAVGLDISADGLRRLLRMIDEHRGIETLNYEEAIDPELRGLLQPLSSPEPEPGKSSGFHFMSWLIGTAWAGDESDRLNRWAPSKDQLGEYLPLIAKLLDRTAGQTMGKHQLEPPVAELFRTLVIATAWQESCWRQYVINKKKIEPLRSGTGDVGLMQINEKVWRGFYDIQKLRWDIAYNSRTGSEILLNYLLKYALKQGENRQRGGLDNLARASYSAYNGGPAQVARYRNPRAATAHKKIDAAFWSKYQQVKAGRQMNVAQCLGGEATASSSRQQPAKIANNKDDHKPEKIAPGDMDKRWVLSQREDHYTLQLAAFSTRESARKFIAQQPPGRKAHIYPVRKSQTIHFLVLHGSYKTRSEADRAKQRMKNIKPWVRQFGSLRDALNQ